MPFRPHLVLLLCLVLSSCGDDDAGDGGIDARPDDAGDLVDATSDGEADASTDARSDAATDAAMDAAADASADAGPGPTSAPWGNPQIAASLADTEFGGRQNRVVSHRVRFERSGRLVSAKPYIIFVASAEGGDSFYHKGDGGTFQLTLESDDGSEEHLPAGDMLAQSEHIIGAPPLYAGSGPDDAVVGGDAGDSPFFRNIAFRAPVDVEAGRLYHLVFRNTTLDPSAHFVSADNFHAGSGRDRGDAVPTYGDANYAVLYQDNGGAWNFRSEHWVIGEFRFADGGAFGNGYMEVGSVDGPDRAARYVDDARSVRQSFTPPRDLTINTLALGAMHVSGDNELSVILRDEAGASLASTLLRDFPTGMPSGEARGGVSTGTAEFRVGAIDTLTLQADTAYTLEVVSTGGELTVTATRDGTGSYDFSPGATVVGHAQFRSAPDAEWEGWPVRTTSVDEQFDVSFYLAMTP